MRGGTVVIATSPFDVQSQAELFIHEHESGLIDWLDYHGIILEEQLVLDPQNASFPMPVDRRIAGFVFRETRMMNYPFFTDVRGNGIVQAGGLTTGVNQVTMTWPSPITWDEEKNQGRKVIGLLESSDQSWTSDSMEIRPNFKNYGELGFPVGDQRGAQLLAIAVEGRFDSYFKDKFSPLTTQKEEADERGEKGGREASTDEGKELVIARVIDRSPESARIILFASNSFLTDKMLDLAASGLGTRYLKPVQLVENAIDWSLEDFGLLAIRGRTHFSRTLKPLNRKSQVFWEYLNYGLALFGLILIGLVQRQINKRAVLRCAAVLGTIEKRKV